MAFNSFAVFVYGSLKPGGYYWAQFCAGKVSAPIIAKVRGDLYDLGCGYPGAIFNNANWITGVVLIFNNEADFKAVDQLEGYNPARIPEKNDYERLKVECFTAAGDSLGPVWAYAVNPHYLASKEAKLLAKGDWTV